MIMLRSPVSLYACAFHAQMFLHEHYTVSMVTILSHGGSTLSRRHLNSQPGLRTTPPHPEGDRKGPIPASSLPPPLQDFAGE